MASALDIINSISELKKQDADISETSLVNLTFNAQDWDKLYELINMGVSQSELNLFIKSNPINFQEGEISELLSVFSPTEKAMEKVM